MYYLSGALPVIVENIVKIFIATSLPAIDYTE